MTDAPLDPSPLALSADANTPTKSQDDVVPFGGDAVVVVAAFVVVVVVVVAVVVLFLLLFLF